MTPPWRAQDIPDGILGRSTRENHYDDGAAVLATIEAEFATEADTAIVVWHDQSIGVQPIIWPMLLHRHDNGCARA